MRLPAARQSIPWNHRFHWIPIRPDGNRFLGPVFEAFGCPTLQAWVERDQRNQDPGRTDWDGLVTAVGVCAGRPVAIAWHDFRVNGGSFGRANSRRLAAFLQELDRRADRPPLLYFVNSAGVSLMEGRTVFADAFALWPALLRYAEHQTVLTCASGKCLGLGPLLFGLGHFRVAVAEQTQLNLTGPEVIKLFFGAGVDFGHHAAAERFTEANDLVHELVPSIAAACDRFKAVLALGDSAPAAPTIGPKSAALLAGCLDQPPLELMPGGSDRVRLFVGRRRGRRLGIFLNPIERSDNLITVRTLEKYAAGLDLFRSLGLPIVSFLDSPGFDPRFEQSAAHNNFRRMLWVGGKIIGYPHGSMGIVTGRCFGGAATLAFPRVFGGRRAVAVRGARIGIMQESIVTRLLAGCPRLLAQWLQVAATQGPSLEDLIARGMLDAVVDAEAIGAEVDTFLEQLHAEPPAGLVRPLRPLLPMAGRLVRRRAR